MQSLAIQRRCHTYSVERQRLLHSEHLNEARSDYAPDSPSMLAFLVGSDYWPDRRATATYVEASNDLNWQSPVISSAAKRGFSEVLGPSGLDMNGPCDWVPPKYWWGHRKVAAFRFGSLLGAAVGTPVMGSLKKFLNDDDL